MKRLAYIGIFFLMAAGGLQAVATNRYVATNVPGSAYPFDSWDKAGTNIIEVVAVANANANGDVVFVSNGTYYLTNQISITANVIVTNFTGDRTKVIINGNYPTTTNRCFYMNNANTIVSGFTITNGCANTNDSGGRGGGVYLIYGTVKDCLITGNRSVVTQSYAVVGGGGIWAQVGTVSCCSVVGNVVMGGPTIVSYTEAGGGGLLLYQVGMATNCYVAYNIATNNIAGGGIYVQGGYIFNCTIISNNNYNSYGGGMHFKGDSANPAEVRNCIIQGNTATNIGGGMDIGGGAASITIRNCLITANTVRSDGAGYSYGGGIHLGGTKTVIDSCTIVSNRADSSTSKGGGICFDATCITQVWNCIIYDNYANNICTISWAGGNNSLTAVVYSCTSPGSGFDIVGVVTSRPSFVDENNGNYHLRQDSPCINKGTNWPWMTGATDRDGNPRIRYGTVDMGAYEYISPGTVYKFH